MLPDCLHPLSKYLEDTVSLLHLWSNYTCFTEMFVKNLTTPDFRFYFYV